MKLSNQVSGRFGNNLFQYLAAKVIQHKLENIGKSVEYIFNTRINNAYVITDETYFSVLNDVSVIGDNDVYLEGYFQFDEHLIKFKKYIKSILVDTNYERINETRSVSYLAETINKFTRRFNEDEVIIHFRLDDFIGDRLVMHPQNYIDMINEIPSTIKKVIIVVDKVKYQWEVDYLTAIINYLKSRELMYSIESGDNMFNDFCKLYYSRNFISSNSTYSYLAGLLGEHSLSWCPINTIYSHQKISKFDENTKNVVVRYL
jgi:hypothetical protein